MKEQRKLAAIMFTDIVGYTALMSKDEQKALRILQKNRDLLKSLIKQYNGEWLQAIGDGTLSSFASVVDAVNCALEVQRSLKSDPELNLRIGIHIGDVVIGEGEIYGDGVNVASRLETLADPGGICISGKVYSDIRNKPGIEAVFLDEKKLKNVDLPIKVYALIGEGLPAALAKPYPAAERPLAAKPKPARKRAYLYVGIAALVAVLVVAGYLLWQEVGEPPVPRFTNPTRVTTALGVEDYPTWSPDGGRLAYESNQTGNWDIWMVHVAGGSPANLTADYEGADRCPSWSPDGRQIAFLSSRDGGGYFVMSALVGGRCRKVAATSWIWFLQSQPQWSSDGSELACVVWDSAGYFVEIVSLQEVTSRRLSIPVQKFNVWGLSWSGDGRFLAYITAVDRLSSTSQLWVMRVSDGKGFPVTEEGTVEWSPSWSTDGRYLYFVSNRGGSMDLWRLRIGKNGGPVGKPQPVTTTGLDIKYAKFSPDGSKLAYSKGRVVGNLWRVPILEDRPATWADARQLTFEQANIINLDVSPDGKRLVFHSDLDGTEHLWVMPAEGGELERVTTDPMIQSTPAWSADGREIAFHSPRGGNRDIWVVPVDGGPVRQVTRHEALDMVPAWSPDGREIAFSSNRNGNWDIWVIPAHGGEARQVTEHPANEFVSDWSPDGQWLLFISDRTGEWRLWRVPAAGGNPEPVTKENSWSGVWSPDGKKIYFAANRAGLWKIWEVPVEGGAESPLSDLAGKPGVFQFGPATDGEYLYFTWSEDIRDLWVMDVIKNY